MAEAVLKTDLPGALSRREGKVRDIYDYGDGLLIVASDRISCFDVVLLESVNVFFEDKLTALKEYARIIKPGGYLGITEMTWLKPPKQVYVDTFKQIAFVTAHQAEEWIDLLNQAGYKNVCGSGYPINPGRESKGRFKRYGVGNVLKTLPRIVKLLLTDSSSRMFFQDGTSNLSRDILQYVGYGVFVGQKP